MVQKLCEYEIKLGFFGFSFHISDILVGISQPLNNVVGKVYYIKDFKFALIYVILNYILLLQLLPQSNMIYSKISIIPRISQSYQNILTTLKTSEIITINCENSLRRTLTCRR